MTNNEQRTPDELSRENELICHLLLGWEVLPGISTFGEKRWNDKTALGDVWPTTPKFTTWADAGLILEALQSKMGGGSYNSAAWDQLRKIGHLVSIAKLSPADIRAAGLAFIKSWHGE